MHVYIKTYAPVPETYMILVFKLALLFFSRVLGGGGETTSTTFSVRANENNLHKN